MNRRRFVRSLTLAFGGGILGVCFQNCSTGFQATNPLAEGSLQQGSESEAPVWGAIPPLIFTEGVAGSISIAGYLSNPAGGTVTFLKNDVPLPSGITFDAVNGVFNYDGVGKIGMSDGHVLTASNG